MSAKYLFLTEDSRLLSGIESSLWADSVEKLSIVTGP
jgi:hypothetical protein